MSRIENRQRAGFFAAESGATAVLAALTAPLLLAMAGLAVEGGMAYFKRAKMQSVADAAAYSAAAAFRAGAGVEGAKLEARAIAASLGYLPSDGGLIDVVVNSPPASGPNRTNPQATEVILSFQQDPLLTKVFRSDPYTIRARGVSILNAPPPDPACVLTLDPAGASALHLGGGPRVAVNGCDVIVNSSSASAVTGNGNGALTAQRLDIMGGVDLRGNVTVPPRRTITAPVADPYASLPVPPTSGCNRTSPPSVSNPVPDGVYCGGLSLKNGSFVLSGTYIVIGGDFDVGANANVTGSGVTIITIPDGSARSRPQIAANARIRISAPTSGPYAGVAFFATGGTAAAPDSVKWNGASNIDVTGAIYMPHTNLTLSGNVSSQDAVCTQIVAWSVAFQGDATINATCAGVGVRAFGVGAGAENAVVSLAE
jgi:hypothetical protein